MPAREYSLSTQVRSKETSWPTTTRSASGPKGIKWVRQDSPNRGEIQAYHALEEAAMVMTEYGWFQIYVKTSKDSVTPSEIRKGSTEAAVLVVLFG